MVWSWNTHRKYYINTDRKIRWHILLLHTCTFYIHCFHTVLILHILSVLIFIFYSYCWIYSFLIYSLLCILHMVLEFVTYSSRQMCQVYFSIFVALLTFERNFYKLLILMYFIVNHFVYCWFYKEFLYWFFVFDYGANDSKLGWGNNLAYIILYSMWANEQIIYDSGFSVFLFIQQTVVLFSFVFW